MMEIRNEMEIVFDAIASNESFARVAVAAFVTHTDPTLEELSDIKTAVSEAVTNAIIHGYENIHGYERECRDMEAGRDAEAYENLTERRVQEDRQQEASRVQEDRQQEASERQKDNPQEERQEIGTEAQETQAVHPGKVRVHCLLEGRVLHIEVTDRGRGIEDIEKAMEPLFTTKPELERSGMGFAFMEAFMDELEVLSTPGEGTCVRMTKRMGACAGMAGEE